MSELTAEDIWSRYEAGLDWLRKTDLVERTDRAHRFYIGDQWHGMKVGGSELPVYNFIKPIVRFKVATVSQHLMTANYSPMDDMDEAALSACRELNRLFAMEWEKAKMDSKAWKVVKEAAIQGDAYLYFGEGGEAGGAQVLDNVNVLLSDERNGDLQEQRYIMIRERLFVEDVRRQAEENGIEDVGSIVSDEEMELLLGEKKEQDWKSHSASAGGTEGKVTCLLYLYKDDTGVVHVIRSTRNVIFAPDRALTVRTHRGEEAGRGLTSYPLVSFVWEEKKGSARGVGEVEPLIPNQLIVNKTAARREISIKQSAYPKLAYQEGAINNPAALDKVGGKIAVKNTSAQAVGNMVAYLNPSQVSPDAKALCEEVVYQSRELAGAGDAATGSIDPTQASGTAIIAVRDQTALPLNEQVARYRQFVEDIALLWFDLWAVYRANGIYARTESGEDIAVDGETLSRLKVNVRVDVGQANPFSKMAQEQTLSNLMAGKYISFEEYVDALPEGSAAPKAALQKIVTQRRAAAAEQAQQQMMMQQMTAQLPNAQLM